MKNLLIVESPTKVKTMKKYLGKDFTMFASYGHVRDLIPKSGSVDTEKNFEPKYSYIERNKRHVDAIVKAAKQADALYLATDPDREGEAIAWHISEILKEKKALKIPLYRVVFYEITRSAIQAAVASPRGLSLDLIDAYKARRILDYLVGFNLSPLLWKKIHRGLSAGRVQSPALRMIVEREEEIENFKSREYWTIKADLNFEEQAFSAKLFVYQGEKLQQFSIVDAKQASIIKNTLFNLAQGKLIAQKVEKKQRKRYPAAPFITATLQQEAARKLGFSAKNTMRVAQQLYEGIDIGEGNVGLISYMRTDSTNLAQEAINEIRDFIVKKYGKENLPEKARIYKTKSKSAQEAHEAIRPTSIVRKPEDLKKHLSKEQFLLYSLIWKRTIACQMMHATLDTVTADLTPGGDNLFRASGSRIANPGFILIYQEGYDDVDVNEGDDRFLPLFKIGDEVSLLKLHDEQHFTEPPPRYSEASLIKTLEEYGIGRPSTYATIISTLLDRNYVILKNKRFQPTDIGRIVNRFLTSYFAQYVDYDFTAKLEDQLDAIARGESKMIPLLKKFWTPFQALIKKIEETVERKEITEQKLEEKCPTCGKFLTKRLGRNGIFIGCSGYPECNYTRNIKPDEEEIAKTFVVTKEEEEVIAERLCPNCHEPLRICLGRYGKFIGCSKYPECKYIEPLEKPLDTRILCPMCKKANLLKRKSRRNKTFYSCASYPKCKYAIWDEPIAECCSKCGWPILTIKIDKKRGREKVCPQKECGFREKQE